MRSGGFLLPSLAQLRLFALPFLAKIRLPVMGQKWVNQMDTRLCPRDARRGNGPFLRVVRRTWTALYGPSRRRGNCQRRKCLESMARREGFEPPTPRFEAFSGRTSTNAYGRQLPFTGGSLEAGIRSTGFSLRLPESTGRATTRLRGKRLYLTQPPPSAATSLARPFR